MTRIHAQIQERLYLPPPDAEKNYGTHQSPSNQANDNKNKAEHPRMRRETNIIMSNADESTATRRINSHQNVHATRGRANILTSRRE